MESTSYVFPFRMVFFDLVTTGWIFHISLCENSINQITKSPGEDGSNETGKVVIAYGSVEFCEATPFGLCMYAWSSQIAEHGSTG